MIGAQIKAHRQKKLKAAREGYARASQKCRNSLAALKDPDKRRALLKRVLSTRDDLPAGMDFQVRVNSGVLDDFRGNTATSLPSPQGFTSESGTVTSWSKTESFESLATANTDETTAYWGTDVPGKLTGLTEAGAGG